MKPPAEKSMLIVCLHCVSCQHPVTASSKQAAVDGMTDHLVAKHCVTRAVDLLREEPAR